MPTSYFAASPIALALASEWPVPIRVFAGLVSIDAALVCLGSLVGMHMLINVAAAGAIVVNPIWFGSLAMHHLRR